MKTRFTLTLAALLAAICSNAQITGTIADVGGIGDGVLVAHDTVVTAGQSVGAAGTNQTWNFTDFNIHWWDSVKYVDPSTTANGALFASADLAIDDAVSITYLDSSATHLEIIGLSLDLFGVSDIPARLDDNVTLFQFPLNYQDTWQDVGVIDTTFEDTFVNLFDSIRGKRVMHIDVEVDAWGSLTTVNGTYDVLRMRTEEISLDTAWGYVSFPFPIWTPLGSLSDTVYRYTYLANGEDYPVLEIETDDSGQMQSASYQIGNNVIAAVFDATSASCFGDCDGTASAAGIGGSMPYTYSWSDPASQTSMQATGLCAGTYTVTITDGGGGTSTAEATVGEPSAIDIATQNVSNESYLGNDGAISITVSGGNPGYNYVWSNGATTQSIDSLVGDTMYMVTVTDQNGCTDTMSFSLTSAVGLNDSPAARPTVRVWPNPSSTAISISSTANINRIELLDLTGKLVLSTRPTTATAKLDVSELPGGLYFLRVKADGNTYSKKVIVE